MKKILVVLAIAGLGIVSCKKEETVASIQIKATQAKGVEGDLSKWD